MRIQKKFSPQSATAQSGQNILHKVHPKIICHLPPCQRYTYRVPQTILNETYTSMCLWAEPAVLGSTKTALKFKYEI